MEHALTATLPWPRVTAQYTARLNAEKLKNYIHGLGGGRWGKKNYNMRLAPEDVSGGWVSPTYMLVWVWWVGGWLGKWVDVAALLRSACRPPLPPLNPTAAASQTS